MRGRFHEELAIDGVLRHYWPVLVYANIPNIDHRILRRAADILRAGGLVAWPSDTSWSISSSLDSKKGLESLKKLKGSAQFTPTVVCSTISQFDNLVTIETPVYRSIKPHLPGPFVFVFESRHAIHKLIAMKRSEIGVRIPEHPIPIALIEELRQPIFAITASRHMSEPGWWDQGFAEENLFEYGAELEAIDGIDLIIDSGEVLPKQLATVVSFLDEEAVILRQGIGHY